MGITVSHLSKYFGDFKAVDDVSFHVATGELAALVGPSGSGKSTILRLIAGLERASAGRVLLDGRPVDHLTAPERRVGFVFQHYALFRHMSVGRNIAFGLEVARLPRDTVRERVSELVELFGLQGLEDRLPAQLSGGQRQRVAVARALAPRPSLLLLDEPFSAVDAQVREELRQWLRRLHEEVGITSIFVTHDQEEAFSVADHLLLCHQGRLVQDGPPARVLDHPCSEFAASFLGDVNAWDGELRYGKVWVGPLRLPWESGLPEGPRMRVVARSWDVDLHREGAACATVRRVALLGGGGVKVEATLKGGLPLVARMSRRLASARGLEAGVDVAVRVAGARFFPHAGGAL